MRVSHNHSEHTLRQLRRETRLLALRIALPAIGLAAYYLVTSAVPLFEALLHEPSSATQPQAVEALEEGLTTGVLITIVAIAVYYLALRVLWRFKAAEAVHEASSHFNA